MPIKGVLFMLIIIVLDSDMIINTNQMWMCPTGFREFEPLMSFMFLKEDGTAKTLYLSQSSFPTKIYMNVYENHLSLITDHTMYSKQYICNRCDKLFARMENLSKHQSKCDGTVEYAYPGGVYKIKLSLVFRSKKVSSHMTTSHKLINQMKPLYHSMKLYSTIKDCNVLEEEYLSFQKFVDQGKLEQEALKTLRLPAKPKTGPDNYQWLQGL